MEQIPSRLRMLVEQLEKEHSLTENQYKELLDGWCQPVAEYLAGKADQERRKYFGNKVFTRGLIEISSFCKNDCLYCGLRRSNRNAQRYRLSPGQIFACAEEGCRLGFRTFVLQGGEDGFFTDEVLCGIVRELKKQHPDCAVTLSMGERSRESYQRLFEAGADRYLLRHETADREHYERLHPREMSFENRLRCLYDLKEIGYQTGTGFMVGSPFQTTKELAKDLKLIEDFRPQMCGIGPFIPHHETVFHEEKAGSVELTLYLLSILRLIHPQMLIPATTALGTLDPRGREKGIESGANVVMPNLSPTDVRKKYEIYDHKICTGEESAQCRGCLEARVRSIGYELVTDRGDYPGTI